MGHLVQYESPLFIWIFSFHMPLFFFLAGITHSSIPAGIGYSLKKIAATLLLPFALFSIVGLFFSLIIPGWFPDSLIKTVYDVCYIVQPESLHVGQIWFLFSLATVKMLFVVITHASANDRRKEFACVALVTATALLIGCLHVRIRIAGYGLLLPFKLTTSCAALLFFYCGYMIKSRDLIMRWMKAGVVVKLCALAVALAANYIFGPMLNGMVNIAINVFNNPVFFLISAFSGILAVLIVASFAQNSIVLQFYGKHSLAIFSCHSFLLYLFAHIISWLFSRTFIIMINIPVSFCLVGLLLVCLLSIPIPAIYERTIGLAVIRARKLMNVM